LSEEIALAIRASLGKRSPPAAKAKRTRQRA
jgi:hypothetical protein